MAQKNEPPTDLVPLNIIRTETALSRYPVHRLAKAGAIAIEIRRQDANGATTFLWEVSYNSRHGQPGPLAYKLDTLVINRRIEEAGRPVPKILKLGSLRDLCRELGMSEGENTQTVRRALRQNASAFISAKITYRDTIGRERTLEADFNRYTILFTGDTLPDGRRADAVYLVLNDVYAEVLNAAVLRPLDYDYLRELGPSAQRFYEIVSYQVYAALRYNLPRARLLYSDFCTYSTLTRHDDYDHVKKQMYKVHKPHLQSEYLARVEFEPAATEDGRPDWVMWYVPGAKARAEFQAFTQRKRFPKLQGQLFPEEPAAEDADLLALIEPGEPAGGVGEGSGDGEAQPSEVQALVAELIAHDLNRADAERLAREKPDECRRQLSFLPFVREFRSSRGAYLRSAIEQGFAPPKEYEAREAEEREKRARTTKAAREKARQAHEEVHRGVYLAYVEHEAQTIAAAQDGAFAAFQRHDAERRQGLVRLAKGKIGQRLLEDFDREEACVLRLAEFFHAHPNHPVLSFWEWDAKLNPEPFARVCG